jgi:hypothetical protein
MKKTLRLEIEKLAKQLLIANADFNVAQMKSAVGKLYETLIVLNHLSPKTGASPREEETDSLDSKSYREENWFKEPEPFPKSDHKDDLVEPLIEKIKDLVAQIPPESQEIDTLLEEIFPSKTHLKNELEMFAANHQEMPVFERKTKIDEGPEAPIETRINDKNVSEKPRGINDLARNTSVGLNDRIAFIKHLFENNTEDYERVLSQISTFENHAEAIHFLTHQVKPDYQNWTDKEAYEARFMEMIAKRFN